MERLINNDLDLEPSLSDEYHREIDNVTVMNLRNHLLKVKALF